MEAESEKTGSGAVFGLWRHKGVRVLMVGVEAAVSAGYHPGVTAQQAACSRPANAAEIEGGSPAAQNFIGPTSPSRRQADAER